MIYGLISFLELGLPVLAWNKLILATFAISLPWYQVTIRASITLGRLVQSLDLSRFLITAHKFFWGFKPGSSLRF